MLFVTLIGTALKHLAEIKAGPKGDPDVTPEDAAFSQALTGSLVGFCVAGFFVSATYFPFFYVLIGMVVAEDSFRARRRVRRGTMVPVSAAPATKTRVAQRAPRTHWVPAG